MPQNPSRRVLDVGQCTPDHLAIAGLLVEHLGAHVDRAHTANEAFKLVATDKYDLVLVNRLLDADGTPGLELIKRLATAQETQATPVMLISNQSDAQDAAVDAGALRGFGKASLYAAATFERLASCLGHTEA